VALGPELQKGKEEIIPSSHGRKKQSKNNRKETQKNNREGVHGRYVPTRMRDDGQKRGDLRIYLVQKRKNGKSLFCKRSRNRDIGESYHLSTLTTMPIILQGIEVGVQGKETQRGNESKCPRGGGGTGQGVK